MSVTAFVLPILLYFTLLISKKVIHFQEKKLCHNYIFFIKTSMLSDIVKSGIYWDKKIQKFSKMIDSDISNQKREKSSNIKIVHGCFPLCFMYNGYNTPLKYLENGYLPI